MPYEVKSSNPENESLEFICDWCGKPIAWTGPDVSRFSKEPVHQEVRYGVKSKRRHYYLHRLCCNPWGMHSKERHAQLLADDRALRGADPKTGRKGQRQQQSHTARSAKHSHPLSRGPRQQLRTHLSHHHPRCEPHPLSRGPEMAHPPHHRPPSCSPIECTR